MSPTKKYIYATNVDYQDQGGAGLRFTANCPKCGSQLNVAELPWWSTKCSCGLEWKLNIEVYTMIDPELIGDDE